MADVDDPPSAPEARAGNRLSRNQLIGRRVGQVVYYAAVGAFAFTATWQVTQQIFYPEQRPGAAADVSCEQGLSKLLEGIEEAKREAAKQVHDSDHEAALNRFRTAITASWVDREAIGNKCRSREHKRLLDALDRLRYSEEHGVRKQAAELTALRRRVSEMAREVLGTPKKDKHHER